VKGRAAIAGFYDVLKQLDPDLVFKPEDTHVLIKTLIRCSPNTRRIWRPL
jgi:hypothetical protein